MKAVVAAFNQEKALVGAFLRDYEPSDGTFSSTTGHWPRALVAGGGCCFDVPLVVCSLHGVVMSWSDDAVIRLVVVFTQSEDRGNMMNNAPWLSKYGKGCRGENRGRGRQHRNWRMGLKVFTYRIVNCVLQYLQSTISKLYVCR